MRIVFHFFACGVLWYNINSYVLRLVLVVVPTFVVYSSYVCT
jgi:hypothetical protein